MKRYPKEISCNSSGQLVVPKEIREELSLDEGTGFWVFMLQDEGILLKKIETPELNSEDPMLKDVSDNSPKIGIDRKNLEKTVHNYRRSLKGGLEEI